MAEQRRARACRERNTAREFTRAVIVAGTNAAAELRSRPVPSLLGIAFAAAVHARLFGAAR